MRLARLTVTGRVTLLLVSLAVLAAIGAALLAPGLDQHFFERGPHFHADPRDNFRPHLHPYQLQDTGDQQAASQPSDHAASVALGPLRDITTIAILALALWVLDLVVPVVGALAIPHGSLATDIRRPILATRADRPPQG